MKEDVDISKSKFSPQEWARIAAKKPPESLGGAYVGCWLDGEMVGYAQCMVSQVLPNQQVWKLEYKFHYSDVNYIRKFYIGPEKWAQEQADKVYDDLPDWMRNGNLYTWDDVIIGGKEQFLIQPENGNSVKVYTQT